jgi:hypothetical protein
MITERKGERQQNTEIKRKRRISQGHQYARCRDGSGEPVEEHTMPETTGNPCAELSCGISAGSLPSHFIGVDLVNRAVLETVRVPSEGSAQLQWRLPCPMYTANAGSMRFKSAPFSIQVLILPTANVALESHAAESPVGLSQARLDIGRPLLLVKRGSVAEEFLWPLSI